MKNLILLIFCVGIFSCTIDPTDYEEDIHTEVPDSYDFSEATSIQTEDYIIKIDTRNGKYYKGYNDIRLRVYDELNNTPIAISDVSFLPIFIDNNDEVSSCPHSNYLDQNDAYAEGYAVFTETGSWTLYIDLTVQDETIEVIEPVVIEIQNNKNLNMTSFIGNDGLDYTIALISPTNPTVSINNIVAGIYKYNEPSSTEGDFPDPSQFSYSIPEDYTLKIDPRMPEASMGNHSSPNNEDLVQGEDKNYHGVVNYTMTGNWTLNFILINEVGEVIKGTEVSTDFTPGIEGVKSELFIDILF